MTTSSGALGDEPRSGHRDGTMVPTLADSALLIQAVYAELSRPNPVTVN